MRNRLFGECLARVVQITGHDVAEILEDQSASGRRFGEIALAWGLCQPTHVWEAWAEQLASPGGRAQVVDLQRVGVDVQATAEVPARLARRMRAVPVRKVGEALVVACDEAGLGRAEAKLPRFLGKKLCFVVAPARQIDAALAAYYPAGRPDPTQSD